MRQFFMTVVQRRDDFDGEFATEPFEAAWAAEAIFFVRTEELGAGSTVDARVQLSADGLRWIDEGTALDRITATGDTFVRVRHFGGWLRLVGVTTGPAQLTVQLALKE